MVRARRARLSEFMLDVAAAFATLATALFLAELLHSSFGVTRLAILFLAAVAVAASLRGGRAAIAAALMWMLFYKLFLNLRTPETTGFVEAVLNLSAFLIVTRTTGALAGRLHHKAAESQIRAERMEALV